jgi:hypothetical protein
MVIQVAPHLDRVQRDRQRRLVHRPHVTATGDRRAAAEPALALVEVA